MSVTGSMYVGISGLTDESQAVSVISNNLANSDTIGYKSSDVSFEDVFHSTIMAGGSTAQVGNGVSVASVDKDFSQGSYEASGTVTDMAIGGVGFFTLVDPDTGDTFYSRAGDFDLDVDGYLVDPHGNRVQGWSMEDGSIFGTLTDVQIDQSTSPPQATSEIEWVFNLNSDSTDHTTGSNAATALFSSYDGTNSPPLDDSRYSYQTAITMYDENGSSHDLYMAMDPAGTTDDGDMVWEYVLYCDADEDLREVDGVDVNTTSSAGLLTTGTMTFNSAGQLTSTTAFSLDETLANPTDLSDPANWVLSEFGEDGQPQVTVNFTGGEDQSISLNIGLTNSDPNTGTGWDTTGGITSLADIAPTTDLENLPTFNTSTRGSDAATSYADSSATYTLSQDGYPPGTLQELEVSENGVISGLYSNGLELELYTVALADFTNPNGLYAEGDNLFSATTESGQAAIGIPGTGGLGTVASNSLESSNVDIATEMTRLVILQSVYQANSKTITTANTLLETAIGLKR